MTNTNKIRRLLRSSVYFCIGLLSLLMWTTGTKAQTTVTIGDPNSTGTSYQIPINNLYGYSYTQQIVLSSEIGMDGTITKLRFYWNAGSFVNNNNWTVYLGYKATGIFSGTTDWVPLSNLTQVFSGTVTQPVTPGFTCEIILTTPFNYVQSNGNLVIAVDQNDPSYTYTSNMFKTTAGSSRAIHYYSDGTNPDPASPPIASGVLSVFNTMQLELAPNTPCAGTPTAGATVTSNTPVCPGENFNLTLSGASFEAGITYQWQSADDAAFTVNVNNLGTSYSQLANQASAKYYRCQLTCTNSGLSAYSTPVYVGLNPNLPGGNYTINSALPTGGSNFHSFNDFKAAMSCGIAGAVVVNVAAGSGPYNEQVEFGQILGASAVNTITINGNGNVLTYASSASATPSTLELNGTDYMIINNLTINATGATYAFACHLWNQADNNTFNNCTFNVPANGISSTMVSFSLSGSKTSATTSGTSGNNNVVTGCTMFSGYYGYTMVGNSSTASTGNQIINCNIFDPYYYASYNLYQDGVIVRGNLFERPTRTTTTTTYYGIYISTGCINSLVEKNRFRNPYANNPTSTGTIYCVYSPVDASLGNENKFYNNVVSDINFNGTIYGMYMSGADYWKAYHNTISLDQTSSTSSSTTYGIYATGTLAFDVRNNIVSISRGGSGTKYCVYYSTPLAATSNNNDLYMNAVAGSRYIGYNGTSYATLSAWQTGSGKDLNSVSVDPMYLAPVSYDYTPNNGLVNDIGAPLGVTTDINNAARSATTPDPGAYEFSLAGLDASITWVSPTSPATAGTYPVTVNISNTQAQTITSVYLKYNDGSGPVAQKFTGLNITAGNNQNLTFTTQYNLINSVTMTVSVDSVNGVVDAVSGNNTDTYSLCIALAGTYTINSSYPTGGINFHSFTDAINALSCGIASPVVFNVASGSGPYNEAVLIPQVTGVSAVNTITINGNGRTLTHAGTSTQPNTLALNGADYFVFNNLHIEATDVTYAIACHLYGGADNNVFNNCTFECNISGVGSSMAPFSINGSATTATGAGISGNNNTIDGCTMIGGYYGAIVYGNSVAPYNLNNTIQNCTVRDFYMYGIYNYYCQNTVISKNIVERPNRTNPTAGYGIYLGSGSLNCLVEKNRVRKLFDGNITSTSATYALYNGASGVVGNENKWFNNLVSDIKSNGSIYGFYSLGYSYVKFYHNTIVVDYAGSTLGLVYGIYAYGTSTDIKNNNVSITRGGSGTKYCVYMSSTNTATCNNNNLYMNAPSGSNYVGYYSGTYATLANWQTANGGSWDQNSVSSDPDFVNSAAGNYKPTSIILNDIGTPLASVTDDILNTPRSLTAPDPGAYEFSVSPKDAGVLALVAPAVATCFTNAEAVTVTIFNFGSTALDFSVDPLTVTVNVTGAATATLTGTATGTLAVGASMNVTMSTTLNMSAIGTYTFNAFTTMASDGNNSNDAMVADTRTSVVVAGNITPSPVTLCVSGTPTLTLNGSSGNIQWQKSTVSATGPWTNVGTGVSTYTPSVPLTQNTWIQAVVSCNANNVTTAVDTITVATPQIVSTTPGSRCGFGNVTLGATGTGQGSINWYDASVAGNLVGTGSSFTTFVNNTTTYYAEENVGGGYGATPILITEMDLGTNDQIEIQNVSGLPVDVTGWKVVVSNSYTDITSVNANIQTLSGTMSPGQTKSWTDLSGQPNYWGSNILWNPGTYPSFTGWAAILDNNNVLVDFVPLNWPAANIQGATININGNNYTVGSQWSGNGVDITTVAGTQSVSRQGNLDNNNLSDFAIIPLSINSTNPGMTIPFTGFGCSSSRVAVTATVNPAPSLSVSAAIPNLCPGGTTTVTVSSLNDPNYTYSWTSNPSGFTASGAGPHSVSPTISTWYVATAIDNSGGSNQGCAVKDSVEIFTGAVLSAGTVSSSDTVFCASGTPTLSVAGADGGFIQWQQSTVSGSGPWNNVGTQSTVYAPGSITQTTWYRVKVSCQSSDVYSNVRQVVVNNPQVTSTTPASRCGAGTLTLGATAGGTAVMNWYANASGGTSLATGGSFTTPYISNTTTYYVGASDGGQSNITIPGDGGWNHFTTTGSFQTTTITGAYMILTVLQPFTLSSMDIYPSAAIGTSFNIEARTGSASGTTVETYSGVTTVQNSVTPTVAQTVPVNWNLLPGTYYIGFTSNPNTWRSGAVTHTFPWVLPGYASLDYYLTPSYQYYFYNLKLTTGCEGIRVPVTATINAAPAITASATMLAPCAGNSTDLSVSSGNSGYSYSWSSLPSGYSGSGAGPLTVNPTVATRYIVMATDNSGGAYNGCGAVDTINITPTVNNMTVSTSATPGVVCAGSNVQLGATPAYPQSVSSYVFTASSGTFTPLSGGIAVSTIQTDDAASPAIPLGFSFSYGGATYTQVYASSNGILSFGAANSSLTNNLNSGTGRPIIAPLWDDLAGTTSAASYLTSGSPGSRVFTFEWLNWEWNYGATSAVISFQAKLYEATGAIEFIYRQDAAAINGTPSASIGLAGLTNGEFLSLNNASASPTASSSIETATINSKPATGQIYTFTPPPASGTFTYLWSPAVDLNNANINNPIAQNVSGSQTYTVVVTDQNSGCTQSANVSVGVNDLPFPIASSGGDVCQGGDIYLTGDNVDPGQTSGNTFAWTGPNGFSSTQQNPIISGPSPAYTGTYTLVVTNSNGCTASSTTDVSVNPNPTLTLLSYQNVGCIGGSDGSITIGASGGLANYDFTVDFSNFINDPAQATFTNLPEGSTTVYVSDANGCLSTISPSLTHINTVAPTQNVIVPISGMPGNACPGTTANLSVAAVANATMYTWDGPPGTTFNGNPSPYSSSTPNVAIVFGTPSTSLYQIGVQAGNGCGNSIRKIQKIRYSVLAFAAGAMIYVVVEELLPEAQSSDSSDYSTIGCILGFALMMVLDITLG